MMRLLITRPEPDASKLSNLLNELGCDTLVEPLLRVEAVDGVPSLEGIGALVITSRNALRVLADLGQCQILLSYPLFTVGKATACMARELGFSQIIEGDGAARDLPELISKQVGLFQGDLLYLSADEIAFDLVPALISLGLGVRRKVVYTVVPAKKLSEETQDALVQGTVDGVILMSPKTTRLWVRLLSGIETIAEGYAPKAFCISSRAAEPLKILKNVSIRIAKKPNIEDLLALIKAEEKNSGGR